MTVYVNGKASDQLTSKTDTVTVTGNKTDNVYGTLAMPLIDGYSTFTPGDSITGNGKTILNLSVAQWSSSFAMPGATVSGVKALNLNNLANPGAPSEVSLDATLWGDSFKKFAVSGVQNLNLYVSDLTVGSGSLTASASGNHQGVFIDSATIGDAALTFDVNNETGDATTAKAVFDGDRLLAKGGDGDEVMAVHETWAATVADIDLGKVKSVAAGTGVSIAYVDEHANAAGSASVGNVTVGTVQMQGGGADAWIEADAESTLSGNATTGNISITNIDVSGTAAAESDVLIENQAFAVTGNATVGSVSVSNIDISLAKGGDLGFGAQIEITQEAHSSTKGNAEIKDATTGEFVASIGAGQDIDYDVYQVATAVAGNALLGSLTLGAIDITATGDGDEADDIYVGRSASVDTGNATVGATKTGAVTISGNDADILYSVNANVGTTTAAGVASVGEVTIGDVSASGTSTEAFAMAVEVTTTGGSYSDKNTIGKVTAGAVTATTASGDNHYRLTVTGGNGSVGTVTSGDVNLTSSSGAVGVDVHVTADNALGEVKLGSYSATSGGDAAIDIGIVPIGSAVSVGSLTSSGKDVALNLNVGGAGAAVGNVTVGNVSANILTTGSLGPVHASGVDVQGATVGAVTLGNVSLTAAAGATLPAPLGVSVTSAAAMGNVNIANVDVTAAAASNATTTVNISAGTTLSSVTLGNLSAGSSGTVSSGNIEVGVSAGTGSAALFTGNLTATSTASANISGVDIRADGAIASKILTANSGAAGNTNITSVSETSSVSVIGVNLDALTHGVVDVNLGSTTAGNSTTAVNVTGALTADAVGDASAINFNAEAVTGIALNGLTLNSTTLTGTSSVVVDLAVTTGTGGSGYSIDTGAISASAGVLPGGTQNVSVSLDSGTGTAENIRVGNVTVTGGSLTGVSSLATLQVDELGTGGSWIQQGDGNITIANIDYSGYVGASTIDLWNASTAGNYWAGALDIKASLGGSDITGNATQNIYHLADNAAVDTIEFLVDQANGWSATSNLTADNIIGFNGNGVNAGDLMKVEGSQASQDITIGGASDSYADFYADANSYITGHSGTDVYAAQIGATGVWYVAVNSDGDGDFDYSYVVTNPTGGLDVSDFQIV